MALVERWPLAEFRLYLFVGVWTSNETLLLMFELHLFVLSSNWLMNRTVAIGQMMKKSEWLAAGMVGI